MHRRLLNLQMSKLAYMELVEVSPSSFICPRAHHLLMTSMFFKRHASKRLFGINPKAVLQCPHEAMLKRDHRQCNKTYVPTSLKAYHT